MMKLSLVRPVISLSPEPFTVTGTTTRSTFARILKSCALALTANSMNASATTNAILSRICALRRIVTLPCSYRITGLPVNDFYLAEFSVSRSVRGVVTKAVLATQFLSDLIEDFLERVLIVDDECRAAGFRRKLSERSDVA